MSSKIKILKDGRVERGRKSVYQNHYRRVILLTPFLLIYLVVPWALIYAVLPFTYLRRAQPLVHLLGYVNSFIFDNRSSSNLKSKRFRLAVHLPKGSQLALRRQAQRAGDHELIFDPIPPIFELCFSTLHSPLKLVAVASMFGYDDKLAFHLAQL